jgi:hypothetical protein
LKIIYDGGMVLLQCTSSHCCLLRLKVKLKSLILVELFSAQEKGPCQALTCKCESDVSDSCMGVAHDISPYYYIVPSYFKIFDELKSYGPYTKYTLHQTIILIFDFGVWPLS